MNIPAKVEEELKVYGEWIKKYRANEIGEIKMQKIRLQLGTYHQRQDGVQMQRIKFPGGVLSAAQLTNLADTADKYAGGFIHFTTRADGQLYYIKLEETPDMLRMLATAGITTREACGNTVRNITACYRSGMSASEPFDVAPYAEALYAYLVRNKYNQVMGRKMKFAFESCAEDHAGMKIHDLGFQGVIKDGKRGFRTYIGGGLGATPMLGHLYTDFLPEEELLNLTAATVRIFDRHGERKNRMAARMKYLVKKIGWDKFKELLDAERKVVKLKPTDNDFLKKIYENEKKSLTVPENLPSEEPSDKAHFDQWLLDSKVEHKNDNFVGINVRLKLGDLVSEKARALAKLAEMFSAGQLKITIEQNLFLPHVPKAGLGALYNGLKEIGLAEIGAETLADTTTCPGADTCRLGVVSAKGLGAHVSELMENGLSKYKDITKDLHIKMSGCPNNCAQHGIANIGFQGAALRQDGKTVPSVEVFAGGAMNLDETVIGERLGKIPTQNGGKVVEAFVKLYAEEKQGDETFNACLKRLGKERLQEILKPFQEIPSFEENPDFYKDWGHENEVFVMRTGVKGECAGAPVQEKAPTIEAAKERCTQAEAFLKHKEYENALLDAYEAIGLAARVPLYQGLVDPFTSEQAIWEFENLFARTGKIADEWIDLSDKVEEAKVAEPSEENAKQLLELAERVITLCESLSQQTA